MIKIYRKGDIMLLVCIRSNKHETVYPNNSFELDFLSPAVSFDQGNLRL